MRRRVVCIMLLLWAELPASALMGGARVTNITVTTNLSSFPSNKLFAPLPVFFDASKTTANDEAFPFHKYLFVWDFGDPGSGTWSYSCGTGCGNTSRNVAYGAVAAHVYEVPDTYTWTLTIYRPDGTLFGSTTGQVTVVDLATAGIAEICIGRTVVPTPGAGGCPAAATAQAQSNFRTIFSTLVADNTCIYLQGGDIFDVSVFTNVAPPGTVNWCIRSFGTGNAIIQNQGNDTSGNGPIMPLANTNNIRVLDITFDPNGFLMRGPRPTDANGTGTQTNQLWMNLEGTGLMGSGGASLTSGLVSYIFYVNLDFEFSGAGAIAGVGMFVGNCCSKWAFIGNRYQDTGTGGQQLFRWQTVDTWVISNNHFENTGSDKNVVVLHGPRPAATVTIFTPNRNGVFSDNFLYASDSSTAAFQTSPEAANGFQIPPYNILVERNFMDAGASNSVGIIFQGQDFITLRSNVISLERRASGLSKRCVSILNNTGTLNGALSPYLPNSYLWIDNNTCYAPGAGTSGTGCSQFYIDSQVGDTLSAVARNNIAYGNATSNVNCKTTNDLTRWGTWSNNSSDSDFFNTDPAFANAGGSFFLATDFQIGVASPYATFGGGPSPAIKDMGLVDFPQTTPSAGGWQFNFLLRRAGDPAANDNSPAWLDRAA
jgi:hypothetical protein